MINDTTTEMLMYAPGEVFGQKDVWLWFDKSLVSIDNPQINYLTAHTNDKFYLILMNESRKIQKLNFCFNAGKISKGKEKFDIAKTITANNATLALSGNRGTIEIPPRGFKVLEIDHLNIELDVHKKHEAPAEPKAPYFVEIDCTDSTQVRAASIKMKPGPWQAFVYSTAESKTLKKITLHWETTTRKGILVDTDYPYEFSVTVAANDDTFKFKVEAVKVNGEIINIEETTIGVVSN